MIGKASEIKTKQVSDGWKTIEGGRTFIGVDDAINEFLATLPETAEVVTIQYQTSINEQDYDHHALIVYRSA